MAQVEVDASDLKANTLVDPAWYQVLCTDVADGELAKSQKSTNFMAKGKILRNDDTGSEEFAEVPLFWLWNSAFKSAWMDALKAAGEDVNLGRYDLKFFEGKTIVMFIDNRSYEGKMRNNNTHQYRPLKG